MVKQREQLKFGGKANLLALALFKQTVLWADLFERVTLSAGKEIITSGRRSPLVYFPIDCVVSLVTSPTGDKKNEVTLNVVGSGDIVGVSQLLGEATSPVSAIVDMGGQALQCSSQAARRFLDEHEDSRHLIQAYENLSVAESWQWLAASVQLPVLIRVAAYLLINWRTSQSDVLPVTHLMMSNRMAIRRPSITEALKKLSDMNIIRQGDRGRIDVVDGYGLEMMVNEAWPMYGKHRHAFISALGDLEMDKVPA